MKQFIIIVLLVVCSLIAQGQDSTISGLSFSATVKSNVTFHQGTGIKYPKLASEGVLGMAYNINSLSVELGIGFISKGERIKGNWIVLTEDSIYSSRNTIGNISWNCVSLPISITKYWGNNRSFATSMFVSLDHLFQLKARFKIKDDPENIVKITQKSGYGDLSAERHFIRVGANFSYAISKKVDGLLIEFGAFSDIAKLTNLKYSSKFNGINLGIRYSFGS